MTHEVERTAGSNQNAVTLNHWPPQAPTKGQYIPESTPRGIQEGDDKSAGGKKGPGWNLFFLRHLVTGWQSWGMKAVPLPTWWLISVATFEYSWYGFAKWPSYHLFRFWSRCVNLYDTSTSFLFHSRQLSSEHKIWATMSSISIYKSLAFCGLPLLDRANSGRGRADSVLWYLRGRSICLTIRCTSSSKLREQYHMVSSDLTERVVSSDRPIFPSISSEYGQGMLLTFWRFSTLANS